MRHAAPAKHRTPQKSTGFPKAAAFASVGLLAVCTVILFVQLIRFNVLPSTWLIVAGCVFALLVVLLAAGCDSKKKGLRVVCFVFALLISAVLLAGIVYLHKTMTTLDRVTGGSDSYSVSVYVRVDDPAQSLADTQGYSFGVMDILDRVSTDSALRQLEESVGSVSSTVYPSPREIGRALLDGEVQAILLNEKYLTIVRDSIEGFEERVRVLAVFDTSPVGQTSGGSGSSTSSYTGNEDLIVTPSDETDGYGPFIVYLTGIDTYGNVDAVSRSDVNILAVVNPQTKQLLLVTTPRDSYMPLPLCYYNYDKLTHAGLDGVEGSMVTLEQFYNVPIPYYVRINFTGFSDIVDALGGIDVYSEHEFYDQGYYFENGYNHLDGAEALVFVRARSPFSDGDFQRGKNQMAAVKAIVDKVLSPAILSSYLDLMDSIAGSFSTNISNDQISDLVRMQLEDNASWNIVSYEVSGDVDWDYCYNMGDYASIVLLHEDSVSEAQDLIRAVFAGEIIG